MALDVYSACPGGTGKKIKFCCSDFVGELQKIERMLVGEQYLACLQYIDRLTAQEPGRDRPCLIATKGLLLRATGQNDAAGAHAADFLAKHPNNQIALAESAILTVQTDARAALGALQRALRYADGGIAARTYEAMGYVAAGLLDEGYWLPGRALLQLQVAVQDQDQDNQPVEMLLSLNRSTEIPLLLRDDPPLLPCPDGVAWRDRYLTAVDTVGCGDWETAARKLTEMAADAPDSSVVWRTLATLRGWLTDNEGGIEALRKYAALRVREEGGLEDAVEAEATALFLSSDPLGDQLDLFHVTWTVKDVDRLQEALLSAPRLRSLPFDLAQFVGGETPPPKAAFIVFNRPASETSEGLNLDNMPRMLSHAMLFGRQTDREARLEMMNVAADDLPAVKALLGELAVDAVEPDTKDEVMGHWSASQKLLRFASQPPQGTSPEQLHELFARHLDNGLLKQWPDLKLGILDDRTPREAAGDATCRVRLLAAIMVLEYWSERLLHEFDFNRLRGCLGLPVLGPIDPQNRPVAELPLVRLGRLALAGLSDGELVLAYRRAAAFAIRPAMQKFAQAIIERPSLSGKPEQLPAYGTLARTAEDPAKAMQYINQGRSAAETAGQSSASWDLLELSLCFGQREGHDAMRLIEHIQSKHLEEPGVGEALTHMLIEVGLLRPDGTPAFGPDGREPVAAAAAEAAVEPGKLWTPDSAQSGGGKLWTPE